MEIRLNEIELTNFKGVKDFLFTPAGKSAAILGNNATGKTTVADAFRWLLFGKDMSDRADFAIKTLDPEGQEISGLDHTVRASIEIDGKPLELAKTYKEKWTKRRGDPKKTLTGHTTDYSIDGVPCQKKEWDSRLNDLISEDVFKLITSPACFNSLHWQKRREILLDVCGDVSDSDVIESDQALGALPEILNGRSLDDQRKVVAAARKKINDKLRELPARIDELLKSLPEIKNRKAVEAVIKLLDERIEKAKDNAELPELRSKLAMQKSLLAEAQLKHDGDVRGAKGIINARIDMAQDTIRRLKDAINVHETADKASLRAIEANRQEMVKLRARYAEIVATEPPQEDICFNCGGELPQEMIEAALANFNDHKAIELTTINDEGKALHAETQTLGESIAASAKKIAGMQAAIKTQEDEIEAAEGDRVANPQPSNPMLALQEQIAKLQEVIEAKPQTDTKALEAERREEFEKLAALDQAEKTKKRIEELKDEEKNLSSEFERLEGELDLMDKFVVQKVNMLEEKINTRFELARFKMFNVLVNGGIEECCTTTVGGVPFGSGLNHGAEINVGLDIIRTLSEFYDVWGPVWIDNREAITQPLEIPSQTISLIVSPDHPEMEVRY